MTNASRNANVAGGKSRTNGGVEKKSSGVASSKIQIAVDPQPQQQAVASNVAAVSRQNNYGNFEEPSAASRPVFQRPANVNANSNNYQYSGQVDNIDERDREDPLCATEYVQDMYTLFRERESITSVRPVFMEGQPHINERMRSILVDWLVEVHLKFKLVPETLYLTVNLIDRYLEREEVSRPKLQLVGVTSLLISSKYEEIYPPELRDLVYICDRAYTRNDVSHAAYLMLLLYHNMVSHSSPLITNFPSFRSLIWRKRFSKLWSTRSPFQALTPS